MADLTLKKLLEKETYKRGKNETLLQMVVRIVCCWLLLVIAGCYYVIAKLFGKDV